MNKHQLCCIGHITLDKVVTPQNTVYMPGGTAFYCSHAIRHFNDIDYALVTAVGATEMKVVEQLRKVGINVTALPSKLCSQSGRPYPTGISESRSVNSQSVERDRCANLPSRLSAGWRLLIGSNQRTISKRVDCSRLTRLFTWSAWHPRLSGGLDR